MGGRGSGSWYRWDKKATTNDYRQLRISRLVEEEVIKAGVHHSGVWQWMRDGERTAWINYRVNTLDLPRPYMQLTYTVDQTERVDYPVYLKTTRPHYGGMRWWFECPGQGCSRRVAVLYGGKYFVCRHCRQLAYHSQNQPAYDRLCDKAWKIAEQLGHEGNVIDGFYGKKPKGMHWKTYHRKVDEMEDAAHTGLMGAVARFGQIF